MYIYKITNNINGKIYIGKTVKSIERRFWEHKNNAKKGRKTALYNAIRKYGEDNFSIEIICNCNTLEELNEKEIYYINKFNSSKSKYGYNLTSGGDGGPIRKGKSNSDYQKNKIREYMIDHPEHIKKFRDSGIKYRYKKGNKPWFSDNDDKKEYLHTQMKRFAYKCIETGKIYKSTKDAELDTGDSYNKIYLYCTGKLKPSERQWKSRPLKYTWERIIIPKEERILFWSN